MTGETRRVSAKIPARAPFRSKHQTGSINTRGISINEGTFARALYPALAEGKRKQGVKKMKKLEGERKILGRHTQKVTKT